VGVAIGNKKRVMAEEIEKNQQLDQMIKVQGVIKIFLEAEAKEWA
jgi:hypothetical protein